MNRPANRVHGIRRVKGERSGFALIVTVSLLSLLVLVLVALASLTRIESSIGRNSLHFAQARQNALFALDVAIGELQLHAGPDARITGRADLLDEDSLNPNWTAIWNADGTLRTWLVSGNENVAGTPNFEPGDLIGGLTGSSALTDNVTIEDQPARLLVGSNTVGPSVPDYVVAPTIDLSGPVPGGSASVVQGRYAWWVGDEGVKASLALEDFSNSIDFAPYFDSGGNPTDNYFRLRQQVPRAHQLFRNAGGPGGSLGFDPEAEPNSEVIQDVIARSQLRFLNPTGGVFPTFLRERFHDITTVSFGVLASANPDFPGLKQDLSRAPSLLGPGFQTWANYEDYMETPSGTNTGGPPIVLETDFRRRYNFTEASNSSPEDGEIVEGVFPVLSEFIIQFGFRLVNTSTVQVNARAHAALWNPYTSAFVIEPNFAPFRLSVQGLPSVEIFVQGEEGSLQVVSLQDVLNTIASDNSWDGEGSFVVNLPFNSNSTIPSTHPERWSWLPGRVFNWRTSPDETDQDMLMFSNLMGGTDGWATTIPVSFPSLGPLVVRQSGVGTASVLVGILLPDGTTEYTSTGPDVSSVWSDWFGPAPSANVDWALGFGFRLRQPSVGALDEEWLTTNGFDPRSISLTDVGLQAHGVSEGWDPTAYVGNIAITDPDFLLDRPTVDTGGVSPYSFIRDTPVFELPRMPILSLGMLQHLQLHNRRPFSVGNSWGASLSVPSVNGGGTLGSWFDRFFFSGVTSADDRLGADPVDPLPFFHLRSFDPDGTLDLDQFRGAGEYTSQHLLMAGAFNVNSTSVDAWEAVLRSMQPVVPVDHNGNGDFWDDTSEGWLSVRPSSDNGGVSSSLPNGTGAEPGISRVQWKDTTVGSSNSLAARAIGFFRFSHSAQETHFSEGNVSGIDRSEFRKGFVGGNTESYPSENPALIDLVPTNALTSTDIRNLASRIVANVRNVGPIRSMEDFVGVMPSSSMSILEEAIDFANINNDVTFEGSSQWLSQADVLTAIGPMLQSRSDTFVIRTYGETVNSVTNAVEGRAWCEATVQRVPTTVSGDSIVTPNPNGFGRRFQIVSFRWLTPEDI